MYLLYVDESGSHGPMQGNRAYVLAGLAIHEEDAARLQHELDRVLRRHLPHGMDLGAYELHAAELRHPRRHPGSIWRGTDGQMRRHVLEEALSEIARFSPADRGRPLVAFAEVFPPDTPDVERVSYEALLHRFDEFLGRARENGDPQHGIAISDETHLDRQIQRWAEGWRETSSRLGRLEHLVDVPFFADSLASRLLQAADLVAWSVWRRHGVEPAEQHWAELLGPLLDVREA